ncbi:hypothetical protein A1F97_01380 [Pyrenophora tritici-repentis]|uniref:Uncharacterized protein n=3 Tax=Pyrenophora tritici-repentis TaxID=45151 RepID=A0A2W1HD54_9PLEO|nr:uncharacterized protein PTRG_02523 [Pyrenophora tritici-repentis Pt-1C-BFP]KAI1518523.1 hypothetical protein Ptr86124_001651 [Pyrenophora tritici-repentis]EDU45046.1 conserved hypothetical protein [Pyrenophora tritici-repentis Pt-1C-BFP]KAI1672089.1 hypothetical protein L13192_02948 [Pyrenophora tritici-repentis]KAI1686098.1 hypothetical protein KJE20_04063 [Pyrenophora tritici-repentis]PZD36350.1 hypothetical protein A1F96_00225 [Pyrenophora tritici-repentis]
MPTVMKTTENTAAAPQQPNPPASATAAARETKSGDDSSLLGKGKKLLGLGKKKGTEEDKQATEDARATVPSTTATTLLPSPPMSPPERRASPRGSPRMLPIGASPGRRIRSTSPGLHSPASSLIFERNVQEPEPCADVPAHILTEDHIPPALDATSLAITDNHLNPDEVEIVTHSAHQPVAVAVAGSMNDSLHSPHLPHEESVTSSHAEFSETAPGYGSLDTADPRRLSFISFADVVQAEHVEHDRQDVFGTTSGEALQFMSLSSTANRSPSPVRSAASSPPTTSGAASPKHADLGRTRSPASPTSPIVLGNANPAMGEELPVQIETMRQALRKTHSGDLSGARSQPLSAASIEESAADKPPFK